MKKLLFLTLLFCSTSIFAQVSTTVQTTVSDPDGTVSSVKFELLSGAAGVIIGTPTPPVDAVKTTLSFTQPGDYVFQISATDNEGLITRQQFKVTVLKADNQPPVIQIILGQTIKLPPKP